MHKLYSHKGIVLATKGIGEKNTLVTVFSRGLGRITAKAISSRDAKGKLKGHIVPYTIGTYTFVRGKEGWRLIQANAEKNILMNISDLAKKRIAVRTLKLVNSMAGEEQDKKLFDCLDKAFQELFKIDTYYLKIFEAVLVARILYALGYLSLDDLPPNLKDLENFSEPLLIEVKHNLKSLIERINIGLSGSQLSKAV
ncbi:MAG: recombination protein O N-terminal domain-containing protein [Minisyncoccia bacterium]